MSDTSMREETYLGYVGSPLLEYEVDDGTQVSTAVVEAIGIVSNDPIEALPPLYDAIEPESLDGLFARTGDGVLTFRYGEYLVCVSSEGTVSVYDE